MSYVKGVETDCGKLDPRSIGGEGGKRGGVGGKPPVLGFSFLSFDLKLS